MCNPNPQVPRAQNLKCFRLREAQLKPACIKGRKPSIFRLGDAQLKPTNIKEDSADAQFKPTSIKGRKLSKKPWILRIDRCSTETHKYQGRETQEKILNSSAWQITQLKPTSMKRRKLKIFKLTDAQLKPTSMKNRKSSNWQMPNSNPPVWRAENSKENLEFFRLGDAQLKTTKFTSFKSRKPSFF